MKVFPYILFTLLTTMSSVCAAEQQEKKLMSEYKYFLLGGFVAGLGIANSIHGSTGLDFVAIVGNVGLIGKAVSYERITGKRDFFGEFKSNAETAIALGLGTAAFGAGYIAGYSTSRKKFALSIAHHE